MNILPKARFENIVVQEFSNEILIYDLQTHKTYSLNETASIVYKACDGTTTFAVLKAKSKLSEEMIYFTLDELKKESLLKDTDSYLSPFSGLSRRQVIRQVGLASVATLPLISFLVAPQAADALSACATCVTLGTQCGFVSDGCGNTLNCGNCSALGAQYSCIGNTCSCISLTCGGASANCGIVSDGCGGLLFCGNCPSGQTCGAVSPNVCG